MSEHSTVYYTVCTLHIIPHQHYIAFQSYAKTIDYSAGMLNLDSDTIISNQLFILIDGQDEFKWNKMAISKEQWKRIKK